MELLTRVPRAVLRGLFKQFAADAQAQQNVQCALAELFVSAAAADAGQCCVVVNCAVK